MLVLDVTTGSPAAEVLRLGDVVVAAHGDAFRAPADLAHAIERAGPGGTMRLQLLRGGSLLARELVVGLREAPSRAA